MKISIFTPTHNSKYLKEVYESIKGQNFHEWIIVYNNGEDPVGFFDKRVKEFVLTDAPGWVGYLKRFACEQATGNILLELDHDDLLTSDAIKEVQNAFEDKSVGFVYSNTIHSDINFNKIQRFDELYGWKYREVNFRGHCLDEHISFEPSPESISRIWFAPNHLRAFRKSVYDQVGGYNKDMRILDDLDLMCRMYEITEFRHIDKGLYVYRVHGENTWLLHNAEIQNNVYRIYDQHIERLALAWAKRNGLRMIELGGVIDGDNRYEIVDVVGGDVVTDLNQSWPFEQNSVGVIKANDILEHLNDPIHAMKEAYRVLVPGGLFLIQVPSTDGRGAFQDPTHKSFWNENSFLYYTDARKARYIGSPVRFQATRLFTTKKNAEQVCWTVAHLLSLKDGYRPAGEIKI